MPLSAGRARRRCRIAGLICLGLSLLGGAAWFFEGRVRQPIPLDVPFPLGVDSARLSVPVVDAESYILSVYADEPPGNTHPAIKTQPDETVDCAMDIIKTFTRSMSCSDATSTLSFNWTMSGPNGRMDRGSYGDGVSTHLGPAGQDGKAIGEYAWLNDLRPGAYVFELSHLQVPAELRSAHLRLKMILHHRESDLAGPLRRWALAGLSIVLACAAVVLLSISAWTPRTAAPIR